MAIFGIGAFYDEDVSEDFIEQGIACIGWSEKDASTLYNILRFLRVGDIIYIKSQPPQVGLIIKAVGIVTDNKLEKYQGLGTGVKMKWIWTGNEKLGKIPELDDKYNVRNNSIYEEFNRFVQDKVLSLLINEDK
jgi:hypothetical protein